MHDRLKEKCGVFAVVCKKQNAFDPIYLGLMSLQHRGQESAGIATYDGRRIFVRKDMGLVSEVFSTWDSRHLKGTIGIGHTRYSTTGASVLANAHPIMVRTKKGKICVAHNGNLVNYLELKKKLEKQKYVFRTTSDTEVIGNLIDSKIPETKNMQEAILQTCKELIGSYCLVILTASSGIYAVRDPWGFRPLCLGRDDNGNKYVSSESCAFGLLGARMVREIMPGEILRLDRDGTEISINMNVKKKHAHCMFEYVYFARPDSIMNGIDVHTVRARIGTELAKQYPAEADVVVPVPDCARTAAAALAEEVQIPLEEGLLKNRYVGRTFILPDQRQREMTVKIKLSVIKGVVDGKRVILVDDSIVRGTTIKKLIAKIREAGAKEVHLRIGCPPLISPCYYGIDMATYEELVASKLSVEQIRKKIGADTLGYLGIDRLVKAIGFENLCLGCLKNEYPTRVGGAKVCGEAEVPETYEDKWSEILMDEQ